MSRIREVRKRDSRVVPFDLEKISDAIHRAQLSVGSGDRDYARELAEVVEHFLVTEGAADRRDGVPHIEEIQDVVEKVLMARPDCGEVAKSYILYRRKRGILRETLEVRRDPDTAGLPSVEKTDAGVSSWSKSRISAALIREADLDPSIAEEIAASVEAKVLRTGILLISTALIRELVDNELFERGYDTKLKKQAPLSLPRYDLDQLLRGAEGAGPRSPADIEQSIAQQLLLQYSLDELYSPEVARAHRGGRFYLHSLRNPLRYYRLLVDGKEPLGRDLGELRGQVAREIQVNDADSAGWSGEAFPAATVFRLDCASDGCLEFLDRLIEAAPAAVIRLSLCDTARLSAIADRLRELARVGVAVELLPPGCDGLPSRERTMFVAGKVTLNLPRAAYRSARDSGTSIEGELDELVDLAVKGLLEKARFLSRLHSEAETIGIVGLVGLNECVAYLTGSQLHESAAALEKGRELVDRIAAKLSAEQGRLGLTLALEETLNDGEISRLQELDGRLYPEYVSALLEAGHLYTAGVRTREEDPLNALPLDVALLRKVVPRGGVLAQEEPAAEELSDFLLRAVKICTQEKTWPVEIREDPAIKKMKK